MSFEPNQIRPGRAVDSNICFKLPGGTDENDLWARVTTDLPGNRVICSTFVPDEQQRRAIAEGANIELAVWASGQPPVALSLSREPLVIEEAGG